MIGIILDATSKGGSIAEIARREGVAAGTIRQWITQYRQDEAAQRANSALARWGLSVSSKP